jgi:hypothetical protein
MLYFTLKYRKMARREATVSKKGRRKCYGNGDWDFSLTDV